MLKIDYKFKDESLLRLAMTHSSYANEHHGTHLQCNERLEFLGDSVLGFVTAGYLFTHYPDLPEGDLTKLRAAVVCEGALDEIAHEIGIPEAIRLGHGEEMGGGRKRASILADATEALLGAIFMDGGIEPARAEEQAGNAGISSGRPVRPGPRQAVQDGAAAQLQCVCRGHRQEQKGSRADGGEEGFGKYGMLTLIARPQ